ncbi:DUF3368 domain-containing protein [Thermococcus paralvinellae]|uniref:Nucleic acid-binding protein n=1 Tax=Thermococcus paralvinellae TaxID=582419 RepID=W0I5P0_9EURY|nr:DUF3368 domain-containing protein [Thermococcus paralvinellae]AHF81389.1 nucleic acid-binding protein [Thermococcus paralvinellae]
MFVIDNTVLSNFAKFGKLELLKDILRDSIITKQVLEEFNLGIERGILPKVKLPFKVVELKNEEIELYRKLCTSLGKGEASCIAVAKNRRIIFLSDDLDARKAAYLLGVKVSGTIGVLALGVKTDVLTLEEANQLLRAMIKSGFYSPIESLEEVLKE